ncbi:GntR family transcriptional regulator [Anaerosacchariphilus polymeriproducens]|uniref:GntR family transcriptional regulator n=2 Tax=Anaerosacchariphilus polymeriproducens TaxID=1812858 RepID=A0A371AV94_9FIRM|nr:GntR family transcriptional regulator [Anaerosacchariphilus polymeriproducens]
MNEYLPLRDVVFNTLREAILKGELKPGERLMEIQLAERLGVSRTPIREAIRKLELEGLVLTIPRRGAEVAKMTEKNMREVLVVRKALEVLAVEIACEVITQPQIVELKEVAKAFEQSMNSKDLKKIAEADVRFHDLIYQSTGNKRLVQILNNLREQIYRYRIEYLKDASTYPSLLQEHQALIEGLKNRDKEFVKDIMNRHIENQERTVINIIREQE